MRHHIPADEASRHRPASDCPCCPSTGTAGDTQHRSLDDAGERHQEVTTHAATSR